MKTLILSKKDIREIATHIDIHQLMDEMITRLMSAFESYDATKINIPVRDGFQYTHPTVGLVEWMPAMTVGGRVAVKTVGYHPTNPKQHNLPTILSTTSVYDTQTGHLIGIVDATFLTALRTGAASAIASKFMANPASKIIGLIGAGAQAVTQLHALSRNFSIEKVFVYDIDAKISNDFLKRIDFMGFNVDQVVVTSLETLLEMSDIICTQTSVDIGKGPVFNDFKTKPWLHINAVGADFPGKVELPLSLLKGSFVCPDFREQAIKEGECQQLSAPEIGPNLFELVQNAKQYNNLPEQRTVFDSTGWALEDLVAVEMLMEMAAELNIGTSIQIESISAAPQNPYEFILSESEETYLDTEYLGFDTKRVQNDADKRTN